MRLVAYCGVTAGAALLGWLDLDGCPRRVAGHFSLNLLHIQLYLLHLALKVHAPAAELGDVPIDGLVEDRVALNILLALVFLDDGLA